MPDDPRVYADALRGVVPDYALRVVPPTRRDPDPLHALGSFLAPELTDLLEHPDNQAIPDMRPNAAGKVPSTRDPREARVGQELGLMAGGALAGNLLGGAAARAAPLVGRAASALGEYLPSASRLPPLDSRLLAGAAGGAIGMTPESTEAGTPRLTREQKQKLEEERLRGEQRAREAEAASARARGDAAEAARLDAERAREANRIELERKKSEAEFEEEQKTKKANEPFRKKYPNLAAALPALSLAGSFLAPYLTRMFGSIPGRNAISRDWTATADAAERALASKDYDGAMVALNQLEKFGEEHALKSGGAKAAAKTAAEYLVPGGISAEMNMLPQEIDAGSLPRGDPNQVAAWHALTDPVELAQRAGTGFAGGMLGASLGSHLPTPVRELPMPTARSAGLLATYPDRGALRVRPPEPPPGPATIALTKAESQHVRDNMERMRAAVPSARLSGNVLEFDPEHAGHFLDFVDASRAAAKEAGKRVPPNFYRPQVLENKIQGGPDEVVRKPETGDAIRALFSPVPKLPPPGP